MFQMARTSLGQIAYILTLIGGILLVIFGLLNLLAIEFGGPSFFYWTVYSFAYSGIVMLICGVIAIIGSRSVTTLVWSIVLIIVGLIGGGLGGLLVVLGGIIGLIIALSKGKY
jgi:hypothetical protein